MTWLTYIRHELWRRPVRTVVNSLALAVGTGLVVGILAASNGVARAEHQVLSPLSNVGADLVVGQPSGGLPSAPPDAPSQGSVAAAKEVMAALMREQAPGTSSSYRLWTNGALGLVPQSAASAIGRIDGVQVAAPALIVQLVDVTGTVSDVRAAAPGTGSATPGSTPLTAAEQRTARQCLSDSGVLATGGNLVSRFAASYPQCFPDRITQLGSEAQLPSGSTPHEVDFATSRLGVAGIETSNRHTGLITAAQLVAGSWFRSAPSREALVNVAYAGPNHIRLGQTIDVANVPVTVVGLVNPSDTTAVSDLYLPLATVQAMAADEGQVDEILVRVSPSASQSATSGAILRVMPGAQVLSGAQSELQLTGVLATASRVASDLRLVVGVIVLVVALLVSALTTLGSISRRTREIGILRALGWSKPRVVRQLLGETLCIGIMGAVIGVLLGIAVGLVINSFDPVMSYSVAPLGGLPAQALLHNVGPKIPVDTVVQLRSVVTVPLLLCAALLCVAGGLLTAAAGIWKAARVVPAVALRSLE